MDQPRLKEGILVLLVKCEARVSLVLIHCVVEMMVNNFFVEMVALADVEQ